MYVNAGTVYNKHYILYRRAILAQADQLTDISYRLYSMVSKYNIHSGSVNGVKLTQLRHDKYGKNKKNYE